MYTRQEWAIAFLKGIGNLYPHPWIVKYVVAWTQFETDDPNNYALHNLLNTEEKGYGSDLLPLFNPVGVRQYPTFEDGIAANVSVILGGPQFYYPDLLVALRTNNGVPLGAITHIPYQSIIVELNTWGTGHATDISLAADDINLRMGEEFPGRHVGTP